MKLRTKYSSEKERKEEAGFICRVDRTNSSVLFHFAVTFTSPDTAAKAFSHVPIKLTGQGWCSWSLRRLGWLDEEEGKFDSQGGLVRAGEVTAQWLRVWIALPGDLSMSLWTHAGWLTTSWTPASGGSDASCLFRHLHSQAQTTSMYTSLKSIKKNKSWKERRVIVQNASKVLTETHGWLWGHDDQINWLYSSNKGIHVANLWAKGSFLQAA